MKAILIARPPSCPVAAPTILPPSTPAPRDEVGMLRRGESFAAILSTIWRDRTVYLWTHSRNAWGRRTLIDVRVGLTPKAQYPASPGCSRKLVSTWVNGVPCTV
jgi:hypothetical protein